jgi:hypothetical protein
MKLLHWTLWLLMCTAQGILFAAGVILVWRTFQGHGGLIELMAAWGAILSSIDLMGTTSIPPWRRVKSSGAAETPDSSSV